jgi:predicted unusual protein kinase regulating ubiquinone biosynthesis (AarF/ABC1/UbiB family)
MPDQPAAAPNGDVPLTDAADVLGLDGDNLDELVTSWVRRSGGAAKVALGLLGVRTGAIDRLVHGERLRDLRTSDVDGITADIADFLSHHKGALMKVGQMLSYVDLVDLPPSARDLLESLQATSTPMSPEVIAEVVRSELGDIPHRVFARWTPRPFAAASIGQVHRARLHDGTPVAVKVQYPGVEAATRNDLRSASLLAAVLQPVSGEIDSRLVAKEIRTRLLEECDYLLEANNQQRFRAWYLDDPEISVPQVFAQVSSKRVLTTGLSSGRTWAEFADAPQEEKDRAGLTIFRMVFTSIFRHHCFNADPHPGNYLFRDDGIDFVDFGCVRRFTAEFVRRWRGLMRAVLEGDEYSHRVYLDSLRLTPEKDKRGEFDYAYHLEISQYLYRPWLTEGPFRYTQEYVKESFKLIVQDNPNRSRLRLPAEFVFVNRLQWGLNSVLAALDAEACWRDVMLPLLYDDDPAA